MLSIQNISKAFGRVRAVRDVSFEVAPGQVVGLLGANGAGKTTTIRMIAGFTPPDAGRITVAGFDTLRQSESARRSIGYLPEAAPAYGEMAVADYLAFRARLYGLRRSPRRAAIESALESCQLGEVRQRRIGHLSRGFRQRVGLAAAILHSPPVLILDEPTSALDPRQIRHIRSLVRQLARDRAVLVSSHILPEVEQTCDRVVIMARGQIRVDARPMDLLRDLREAAPYIVELRADFSAASAALSSLPGIAAITPDGPSPGAAPDPWLRIRITAAPGTADLRAAIARALSGAGLAIRELRRETPGLERLFLQLIETEEQTHHASPAISDRAEDGKSILEEVA